MINKIKHWMVISKQYGWQDEFESFEKANKFLKANEDCDNFIDYAEPFEPIKLTKGQADEVAAYQNDDELSDWYDSISLLDDELAFLFLHRANWREFVEIEPDKKYYLISRDLEAINNDDKYLNLRLSNHDFVFGCYLQSYDFQTQFTQAEIDKLGDRVKNLRKEEVK